MNYKTLANSFGGNSKLFHILAFISCNVAFYIHPESINLPIFMGVMLSICGLSTYRAIKQDSNSNDQGAK